MFYYGGQAVLEGVMMRGRDRIAVAVRRPDSSIAMMTEPLDPRIFSGAIARTPFLRGIVMLWEMMSLGIKAMAYSARVLSGEEEQDKSGGSGLGPTVALSLAFSVGLFFLLPLGVASLADPWLPTDLLKNGFEGAVRLGVLVLYILAIGRIPEIRRVFGYHGAEHKTVNAYEAGAELTPREVARYSTRHPRCGTGFLLFVVLVSVFVFALAGWPSWWLRILSRIVLVPVIASIAYELIRLGARYYHLTPVRLLLAPSLAMQGLTTREPDEGMLEVAITALEAVLPERVPQAAAAPELV
ncbi:MAG: DUF1385 domain-containing protein [Chloroflexota bacterium]|nr:DUF1385 domain-containing protein [Chloroflexota bacterium]